MKIMYISSLMLVAIVFVACGQSEKVKEKTATVAPVAQVIASSSYKKGDRVPNEEVCMVNDAHMGKKQIEVPHNGNMYYGCCQDCVKRIPKDEKVRKAVDPMTGKTVDKANAYIVLLSDDGHVAYFETEATYQQFIAQNK